MAPAHSHGASPPQPSTHQIEPSAQHEEDEAHTLHLCYLQPYPRHLNVMCLPALIRVHLFHLRPPPQLLPPITTAHHMGLSVPFPLQNLPCKIYLPKLPSRELPEPATTGSLQHLPPIGLVTFSKITSTSLVKDTPPPGLPFLLQKPVVLPP